MQSEAFLSFLWSWSRKNSPPRGWSCINVTITFCSAIWETEDKALHNLCSLFSGRNFRKCQDVEEKTKSIQGNEWTQRHPEWIFLGDCLDVGYFQGSPRVPQNWPWRFCGCFPNSTPLQRKKGSYTWTQDKWHIFGWDFSNSVFRLDSLQ